MTESEINAAVARKLGYEFMDIPIYGDVVHRAIKGSVTVHGEKIMDRPVDIPDYCRSIAAAWEVVLFLKPSHFIQVFEYPTFCMCHIIEGEKRHEEQADTAPMAIVLCFLKMHNIDYGTKRTETEKP